ncbi:gfo/Idh/MocA family oxidoreductase [Candidatus Aerophobetes bacterium]|uniref:Gfo/Idh/MocA family oxidoreductase n=1 Tax=Aerophobetes bacterium TaxID=2030807 RepID=A0A497E3N3_UNCAE|nr:MAG: gfo/Idh/MocA family oxidoreductase [Candidatus Aerophobetes bacterium]
MATNARPKMILSACLLSKYLLKYRLKCPRKITTSPAKEERMPKLGYGIIGCGRIFPFHARAVRKLPEVELVAVSDIVEERARKGAQMFGAKAWYTDYRKLLDRKDIHLVSICLPHHLHAKASIDAAMRGKHVLCEKPIAINEEEARRMIDECRRRKVKLAIISQNRYNDASQKLYKAFQEGRFGRLVLGCADVKNHKDQSYYDRDEWRGRWATEGGGSLTTQAYHIIDLLRWIMGPVRSVCAHMATLTHDIEVEDTATATLEFENGALGEISSTNSSPIGFSTRLEIHGENGSAIIQDNRIVYWDFPGIPEAEKVLEAHLQIGSIPNRGYGESHPRQIKEFVRDVLEDREPLINGEEALKTSRLIWAIYSSAKSGRKVYLTKGGGDA